MSGTIKKVEDDFQDVKGEMVQVTSVWLLIHFAEERKVQSIENQYTI